MLPLDSPGAIQGDWRSPLYPLGLSFRSDNYPDTWGASKDVSTGMPMRCCVFHHVKPEMKPALQRPPAFAPLFMFRCARLGPE